MYSFKRNAVQGIYKPATGNLWAPGNLGNSDASNLNSIAPKIQTTTAAIDIAELNYQSTCDSTDNRRIAVGVPMSIDHMVSRYHYEIDGNATIMSPTADDTRSLELFVSYHSEALVADIGSTTNEVSTFRILRRASATKGTSLNFSLSTILDIPPGTPGALIFGVSTVKTNVVGANQLFINMSVKKFLNNIQTFDGQK